MTRKRNVKEFGGRLAPSDRGTPALNRQVREGRSDEDMAARRPEANSKA